jgi:hypothetical protein
MSWCVVWFRESFCVCGTTTLLQATTFCVSLILWRTLLNEFWCVGLKTSNFKFSKRFVKTSKVKTSNWNYWELELLQLKNVENVLKSLKFYIFKNVKFDNFIFGVLHFTISRFENVHNITFCCRFLSFKKRVSTLFWLKSDIIVLT